MHIDGLSDGLAESSWASTARSLGLGPFMASLNAQTPNLGKGVSCVHYQRPLTTPD